MLSDLSTEDNERDTERISICKFRGLDYAWIDVIKSDN
jgi:hypothetical protein